MPKKRSYQAELMRRRRQNPAIKDQERRAEQSHDAAVKKLMKRHRAEYVALLQEERKLRGLRPYAPRGTKRITVRTPIEQPDFEKQSNCSHTMGLEKTSYGIFCKECGGKI